MEISLYLVEGLVDIRQGLYKAQPSWIRILIGDQNPSFG